MDEVLHILAQQDGFGLGDDLAPEPDGSLQFSWYEVGPGKKPLASPMDRRVLATLTLTPETLELGTMSEARLARCRQRLERLLGAGLHLLHAEVKSMEQTLAEPPPEDAPEPVLPPPEVIAELEERMLRQWLDESIPALEGKTPREAAKMPEGRQMLEDLFDYIERHQKGRPSPPGMFSPDYRKTKGMLGLE